MHGLMVSMPVSRYGEATRPGPLQGVPGPSGGELFLEVAPTPHGLAWKGGCRTPQGNLIVTLSLLSQEEGRPPLLWRGAVCCRRRLPSHSLTGGPPQLSLSLSHPLLPGAAAHQGQWHVTLGSDREGSPGCCRVTTGGQDVEPRPCWAMGHTPKRALVGPFVHFISAQDTYSTPPLRGSVPKGGTPSTPPPPWSDAQWAGPRADALGLWAHVALVYADARFSLYYNGRLAARSHAHDPAKPLPIVRKPGGRWTIARSFVGCLCEVARGGRESGLDPPHLLPLHT